MQSENERIYIKCTVIKSEQSGSSHISSSSLLYSNSGTPHEIVVYHSLPNHIPIDLVGSWGMHVPPPSPTKTSASSARLPGASCDRSGASAPLSAPCVYIPFFSRKKGGQQRRAHHVVFSVVSFYSSPPVPVRSLCLLLSPCKWRRSTRTSTLMPMARSP